ncbi:NBR1-Ig-like domain-containing protein [Micromonospora sp. NPDC050686]|uniref:NBR1-Ig-like domain-containing protein n=1 Tax=Micromonospora sp. NPDC050686 TaxID=3154631 RepID=UPI0033D1AC06
MGAFADHLLRLKEEAGDPSYEEMSLRLGAAASKSSLAAAAQGRSLPSWETTWEFVRVLAVARLGHDPVETERAWRERWAHAKKGTPQPETSAIEETRPAGETGRAGDDAEMRGAPGPSAAVEPAPPRLRDRRHIAITGVAAAMAALTGAGAAFVVLDRRRDETDSGVTPAVVAPPVHDDSRFEGDITYPDGSLVPPNTPFTKIWRIRNTGAVIWANRLLVRVNETPCQAPASVTIPQTMPGEAVDIEVSVRTPSEPGGCKIYWKMADEDGRMFFPLKRPVFLDVRVGGS